MKKIILFFAMLFVLLGFSQAQPIYTVGPNVYTCKNGVIETIKPNRELNAQELAQTDYQFFNPNGSYYHLGITRSNIVGDYTAYYNCHANASGWDVSINPNVNPADHPNYDVVRFTSNTTDHAEYI